MKHLTFSLLAASIATGLAWGSAHAADYNSGILSKSPGADYTNIEFGSGWYLRGDITYNINGESASQFTSIQTPSDTFDVQADYDDAVGARIGAGYYLTPSTRVELSAEGIFNSTFRGLRRAEYAGSREYVVRTRISPGGSFTDPLTGLTTTFAPIFEDLPDTLTFDENGNVTATTSGLVDATVVNPINGTEEIEASYDSGIFLASAYFDLPKMGRFTPYVGAGAGLARVSYNETRTFTCTPDDSETCAFPAGQQGEEVERIDTLNEGYWGRTYALRGGTAASIDD